MLRSLVLILLLVNAAFYAWSKGWLNEFVGVRPDAQREPQRLAQQINPDKILVPSALAASAVTDVQIDPAQTAEVNAAPSDAAPGDQVASPEQDALPLPQADAEPPQPDADAGQPPAPAAETPSNTPSAPISAAISKSGKTLCVEAGPFTAVDYASAEATLRPQLPSAVWTKQTVTVQGMWLVYMGPYPEAEQLQRKQEELKRIKGLDFEVVRTPANLAPGISLGRFSKQENAENQLEMLRNRGIRTARIVNLRPIQELHVLRIARADVDTQIKLSGLKLPQGKGFTACRR